MAKFKENLENIWKKIKNPTVWVIILFGVLSVIFLFLTVLFTLLDFNVNLVYVFLSLGFFSLVYFICVFVPHYKFIKAKFIELASKNKYTKRYVTDRKFRGLISASISFIINIFYALGQGVFAVLSSSIWYGALSIYYFILSSIRGGIVFKHHSRKKIEDENQIKYKQAKSYRNCGIYLNILTMALSGAIVQMVIFNQGYKYAGIMIYVFAVYAFVKMGIAISNVYKANKNTDLTLQSIRNISLADAFVSMLALQTAMFQSFGPENFSPRTFNAVTGGCVSFILLAISTIMIIRGNKSMKKEKSLFNATIETQISE